MNLKNNPNAKTIGTRFRSARSLVPNLNRKLFCERHGINRYTMQSWENGLHVSKGKNVERFIEALAKEGIACTAEWLIDGIGEPARPISDARLVEIFSSPNPQQDLLHECYEQIFQQLASFYEEINKNTVKIRVNDESMAPKFREGDWLLGADITDTPADAHQKFCIIELGPQRFLIRKVFHTKDHFLLTALDERIPTLSLGTATKIYEIIWHMLEQ
ncbi:MAG: hypothetical protein KC505_08845 [Myxococcales bacterium]|nr:hypothetical protein [Myxococcales bacterium]